MWSCLLNTGVRTDELVGLRPESLNALDRTRMVVGKGRGDGKARRVPVSEEFRDEWQAYVMEHELTLAGWLFPQSAWRFPSGRFGVSEQVVLDRSRHCTAKAARTAMAKLADLIDDALRRGDRPRSSIRPPRGSSRADSQATAVSPPRRGANGTRTGHRAKRSVAEGQREGSSAP